MRDSGDFKERLRAAFSVSFDGPQVLQFLDAHQATDFHRPLLRDPDLAGRVREQLQSATELTGDLAQKSRLLYLGMHWWLRGRYGQGPEGMGLLKSQAALTSPLAQFPLFMPIRPPVPTDPTSSAQAIPKFDRRHHYIWMYEYRRLNLEQSTSTSVIDRDINVSQRLTSRTKLSHFY